MKLLERSGLGRPIVERTRAGMPLWGTCMGMIVAAHDVAGVAQPTLDLIDITVRRNAFGRQNDSAEVPLRIPALGSRPFPVSSFGRPGSSDAGRRSSYSPNATVTALWYAKATYWPPPSIPSSPATRASINTSSECPVSKGMPSAAA